jgi:hypothetical protein
MPIGAINTAVAALFITPDSSMVTVIRSASTAQSGICPPSARIGLAITALAPVDSSAPPTGMSARRRTMTGQSTQS